MNGNAEAARAWLKKAESDLVAAELCLSAKKALDAACFHCQQAAEKSLKAWLVAHGTAFPFVHDIGRLITACATVNPAFEAIREQAIRLTPFAVEMRYDAEFWPSFEDARGGAGSGPKNSPTGYRTLVANVMSQKKGQS
jgi:HEPN domain-containing protein